MSPLVEFSDVSKVYNGGAEQIALREITLAVEAGESVAVMGPSGSGKSTLLNLVAGLDRPTTGAVRYDGLDLSGLGESALARHRRDHLGFIFQFFNLLNNLTVRENVLIPAQLGPHDPRAASARAAELLDRLGLGGQARQYPAKLSGGERQLVAIARALINRPTMLLADEPTGALDTRAGDRVMGLLDELNQDGQTMMLVTHDPKLAARHARRVISLRDGQIVDEAVLTPTHPVTAAELVRVRVEEPVA